MLIVFAFFFIYSPGLNFFPISVKIIPFISGLILLAPDLKFKNIFSRIRNTRKSIYLLFSNLILIICFLRFPEQRFLSAGASAFIYFLLEQKKSSDLFKLFWQKVNSHKYLIFRILIFLDLLIILSLFLNFFGIQMPLIYHGKVAVSYLEIGYRFPSLLGIIGSQGSVTYACYAFFIFTISDLFKGYRKFLINLSIILLLFVSFLSGGSGLFFCLIFYSLFLLMKFVRLIYRLRISKRVISFVIFIFTIITSIFIYLLNNTKSFGFKYFAVLLDDPNKLLTTGTSGYLYKGLKLFPIYLDKSINEIINSGFDSILFGIKTNLTLPVGTDYGLPNLLLLYGLPLTILFVFYLSEILMKSIVEYYRNIMIEDKISFLICLRLALVLFITYYSYKEPVFFNTPCLLPLFYLLNSSIKFKESYKKQNLSIN